MSLSGGIDRRFSSSKGVVVFIISSRFAWSRLIVSSDEWLELLVRVKNGTAAPNDGSPNDDSANDDSSSADEGSSTIPGKLLGLRRLVTDSGELLRLLRVGCCGCFGWGAAVAGDALGETLRLLAGVLISRLAIDVCSRPASQRCSFSPVDQRERLYG